MFGKKKNQLSAEAIENIEKIKSFDYEKEIDNQQEFSELYNKYRKQFCELKEDLYSIYKVSNQIEGTVDNLVDASDSVKNATEFIAKGAAAQAVEVQECSDIAVLFSGRMSDMERMSAHLIDMAVEMGQENANSKEVIASLVENQKKNEEVIAKITAEIRVVLEKTKKINDVTQVLYGIASQTNLLALNASIEAARAGENGRGFSVVADEVRALSEDSRSASSGIDQQIQDISKELDDLKRILDDAETTFANQNEAVEKVTDTMELINSTVDQFVDRQHKFNDEIVSLAAQKERMMESIDRIAKVVEQFSATTEEVASLSMTQDNTAAILTRIAAQLISRIESINADTSQIKTDFVPSPRKKIGFMWDVDGQFWDSTAREAAKTAKIYDYEIEICAPVNRSVKMMTDFLTKAVEEHFDGLVVSYVNNPEVHELVQKAAKQGTKVVFLQGVIPDVDYAAYIGTGTKECGAKAAEAAINIIGKENAAVAVGMWCDIKAENIEQRAEGFVDRIQKTSNIRAVRFDINSVPEKHEVDVALTKVLKENPDIKVIFATNSGWGFAMAEYLESHPGAFELVVTDFSSTTDKYLRKGLITSAIAQRQFLWGSMPVDILNSVFEGGKGVKQFKDTGTYEISMNNIEIFASRL